MFSLPVELMAIITTRGILQSFKTFFSEFRSGAPPFISIGGPVEKGCQLTSHFTLAPPLLLPNIPYVLESMVLEEMLRCPHLRSQDNLALVNCLRSMIGRKGFLDKKKYSSMNVDGKGVAVLVGKEEGILVKINIRRLYCD